MGTPINYKKLEKEYLTTDISIVKLCQKHKVTRSSVQNYAQAHKWRERKAEIGQKTTERVIEQTIADTTDAFTRIATKSLLIFDKKMEQALNSPEECDMTFGQLMHTLKEMKETGIFGITLNEQKIAAEIEKIKKETEGTDDSKKVNVVLSEEVDAYGD